MKKKIINGILMVALVAATSTSFVSCKDNSEDVRTDLLAQVNTDLEPRLKKAESDIDSLYRAHVRDSLRLDTLKADVAGIHDTLGIIKTDLKAFHDSVYTVTQRLSNRLDTVEYKINTIVEALRRLVTRVTVNATSTNILENSKLFPGLNVQFLGAIYGEAKKDVNFPDIEGVTPLFTATQGDLLYNKDRGAGKVYFTINPSNIDAADAEKLTLSLTDSQNGTSLIKLGKAKKSDKVLAWGTRADGDVTLWEADATADPDKLGKLATAEIININQVGEHVKEMVKAAKNVEKSEASVKSTAKEILKETAAMIADLAQTKLPALPALALKAQWKDTVGVRSVISDYSIAATGFKPVDFYWGQGIVNEGSSISLDRLDNAVARVINKLKTELNKFDLSNMIINSIEVPASSDFSADVNVYMHWKDANTATGAIDIVIDNNDYKYGYHTAGITKSIDFNQSIKDLVKAVNDGIPSSEINNIVKQLQNTINTVNADADRIINLENRVSDYLESFINRMITSISTNGLYKILQPILLYEGENGVNRVVSGSTFKAGQKFNLLPTTVTNELLAPAFKKYISVNGKGEVLTNGDDNFKKYEITLQKGENKIVYAALDFYGNQVVKTYTVNAE